MNLKNICLIWMCLFLSSISRMVPFDDILKSHEQYLQVQKFAFVEDLFSIIRIFKVTIEKMEHFYFVNMYYINKWSVFLHEKAIIFITCMHKSGGQSFYGPIFFFFTIFLSLDHSYFLIRRFNVFHFWKIFFWNISKIRRKHIFLI